MNTITLDEFGKIGNYLIDNNLKLIEEGKTPIALAIESQAGIGKTLYIKELCNKRNMTLITICLQEIEDPSEISGFPIKEYKVNCLEDGKRVIKWLPADLINSCSCQDMQYTNRSRMSYAAPNWVPREDNENGVVILFDDLLRGNQMVVQSVMQLIYTTEFIAWKLPKHTMFMITNNPDDGTSTLASSMDAAFRSRFINFNIKFDIDGYAKWAEFNNIDGRGINFAINNANEIFETVNQTINPRSYTMFIQSISSLSNWESADSLCMILNIAKGCFNDPDNIIGHLFTTFINNKLDKLVSPKDMLLKEWKDVRGEIEKCVYTDTNYRANIAGILGTRLLNYSRAYIQENGTKKAGVVKDRILEIIAYNKTKKLIAEDILYNVIRTLYNEYQQTVSNWIMDRNIRGVLL